MGQLRKIRRLTCRLRNESRPPLPLARRLLQKRSGDWCTEPRGRPLPHSIGMSEVTQLGRPCALSDRAGLAALRSFGGVSFAFSFPSFPSLASNFYTRCLFYPLFSLGKREKKISRLSQQKTMARFRDRVEKWSTHKRATIVRALANREKKGLCGPQELRGQSEGILSSFHLFHGKLGVGGTEHLCI